MEIYPELPAKWEDYKIEAKLGEGSYGQVFKVSDAKGNLSALKIIILAPDEITVKRGYDSIEEARDFYSKLFEGYKREIDCMSALKGVSETVQLLEYETECDPEHLRWKLYIRMEYLTPLTKYLEDHRMEEKDILRFGIDLCSALDVCAEKQILHRDIKPDNIFVSEGGTFKLGDFGVARQVLEQDKTKTANVGTLAYAAPEVVTAEYDLRADIYSVGMIMYQMLNEMRMPFVTALTQENGVATSYQMRVEEKQTIPDPLHGSAEIKKVVLKALCYDPNARYSSAASMKRALLHVQDPQEYPEEPETDSEYGSCGKNLTWSVNNNGLVKISGTGEMYHFLQTDEDGILNEEESVGPWKRCRALREVQIESGVTTIGAFAFYYCNTLTSITIPDSVTDIGAYAFRECSSLTSITIPNGVAGIGERVFYNCSSLTSITLPNSATSIGREAFALCRSLTSITIPDSVTDIGKRAFYGCRSLTNITIPDSVTDIGEGAFSDCDSVTNITIPDSVHFNCIDNEVFAGCSSLASIIIPDKVSCIGSDAFRNCSRLTSITIPDKVTSIGSGAFSGCSSLTSIMIPDKVTSIGPGAFSGCSSLTGITIPNRIAGIDNNMFNGCSSLTSITIPDKVTSIGSGAFGNCSRLTSIKIANSVKDIGTGVFWMCNSLTSITIPNGVTSIGARAFFGCTRLKSITIPDSVTHIGDNAFFGCKHLTIYGYPGSAAENHAKKMHIQFKAIGFLARHLHNLHLILKNGKKNS